MDRRTFVSALGLAPLTVALLKSARATTGDQGFDPREKSIAELQQALRAGTVSSEALCSEYLVRIARFDQGGPAFHSVIAVNPEAIAAARALDAERRAGKLRGPLHGIPLLIKDNIETRDPMPTTAGSLALGRARHAADAPLVARLRAAGAVVLGKTNLSEWANFRSTHSSSGWSAVGGQTRNAYDRDRNPSGSSSGSGAAAAASFCAVAIGTETNGSILSPSSLNGLVGLKPTKGLVDGSGVVPISPRQDTAGPMGRCVLDVAAVAAAMASVPLGFGPQGEDFGRFSLRGVRIGALPLPKAYHPDVPGLYAEARAALEKEGAILVDLKPPAAFAEMDEPEFDALLYEFKSSLNAYLAGLEPAAEAPRTLAELIAFNRSHAADELRFFGQEIFEMAEAKGPLSDPACQQALATLSRAADRDGLAALLAQDGVQALLAPSNGPAELVDPVWGDRRGDGGWPVIGSAAAIAGYPSITVPAGIIRSLPVGMTMVAGRHRDGLLLQIAHAFERATRARVAPRIGA